MKNIFRTSGVILLIISIFLIHSCKKDMPTVAIIITSEVTDISQTSATSGGEVTNDGGALVISSGVCWNTSDNPTIADSDTIENGGLNPFTSNITGLTPNTTYYLRAFATNSAGTGYGNQVLFTSSQVDIPVLTTTAITSITETTAVSGGNITADNGGPVTARGVCWSISANPTVSDNKTSDGSDRGIFSSTFTGLIGNTTYYLRAYATNSAGTGYGNTVSFKTGPVLPTVTTAPVSSIQATSCLGGGNVSSDGGAPVTSRGVCWSTSLNPTIYNGKISSGSGTGAFLSSIEGLRKYTMYYVRAFATNLLGTSYGDEITFTTLDRISIIVSSPAPLTTTSATSNVVIYHDGGATITARGVCWSTSHNPTTADNKTIDGSGTGSFVSIMTGLESKKYFIRAYAINAFGTDYSDQQTYYNFGSVNDIEGNAYKTINIGTQVWMAQNLRTTTYSDGSPIENETNTYSWSTLTNGAYCWFNWNGINAALNKEHYGALYNWQAVESNKLCPTGWHVPGDSEWTALVDLLGGSNIAGCKMHDQINCNAPYGPPPICKDYDSNVSGFSAQPTGFMRDFRFYRIHDATTTNFDPVWWSSAEHDSNNAWSWYLGTCGTAITRSSWVKRDGLAVRCIKDN